MSRLIGAVGVALVAASVVLVLVSTLNQPWGDAIFVALVLSGLLVMLQLGWWAYRDAQSAQRRADELRSASPTDTARAAVNAERDRLSRDIQTWLRNLLHTVGVRARSAASDPDPRGACAAIQVDAQQATSELRRQLGLLRPLDQSSTSPATAPARIRRLQALDVVLAASITALMLTELLTSSDGPPEGDVIVTSAFLTTATALTLVGRRVAPIPSALVCSFLLALGALLQRPVHDGLWFPLAVGSFAWILVGLRSRAGWLTLTVLYAAALGSRWLYVPLNVLINALCLAVVTAAGAAVTRSRARRSAAQTEATALSAELKLAADEAVREERLQVARELHDLVSHAVSVIAVQAGAAELLWPNDPAAARRAIDVIESTATRTTAELDQLMPGSTPVHHTMSDVSALLTRMRAAGLDVAANQDGEPPPELVPTVYRVIQESLTNALRYAPTGTVNVEISTPGSAEDQPTTKVHVTTHGSPPADSSRRGYGLIGLSERVTQAGGSLEITRSPDARQFHVTATLRTPSTGKTT